MSRGLGNKPCTEAQLSRRLAPASWDGSTEEYCRAQSISFGAFSRWPALSRLPIVRARLGIGNVKAFTGRHASMTMALRNASKPPTETALIR